MAGSRNSNDRIRLPHAVLDKPSRVLKALKIVDLLGETRFRQARRILEIGCGSGVIASTLADLGGSELEVIAVDIADNRLIKEGYQFQLVQGTALPFGSKSFDVIISNHVIEHVGDRTAQLHHLSEISRVMKDAGCTYLAVPNKWRLIEPHYRLPLLSWIPVRLADAYLHLMRRGEHYDCVPLGAGEAERLFTESGFLYQQLTLSAVYSTLRIEFNDSIVGQCVTRMPRSILAFVKPVISTLIYSLEKPSK